MYVRRGVLRDISILKIEAKYICKEGGSYCEMDTLHFTIVQRVIIKWGGVREKNMYVRRGGDVQNFSGHPPPPPNCFFFLE